ncbi:MAG: hypothetical protein HY390_01530 [Deltaproteobacteria bacterium]|nr:hypothetical protein [Deltaproteobacteria bacterium]
MKKLGSLFWFLILTVALFSLTLLSTLKSGHAQMKRDETTAKEVDKINPVKPVKDATKKILDKTVHQVLPFEIPTDSKITKEEEACYRSCAQERDLNLKNSRDEVERGRAWALYRTCKDGCPEKAAAQTPTSERGVFGKEERTPAGSTIPSR